MRFLFGLILIVVLPAGGAWVVAGRMSAPGIEITKPEKFVGAATPVEVVVGAPADELKDLTVTFEQNGKRSRCLHARAAGQREDEAGRPTVIQSRPAIGKQTVPGPAVGRRAASRPQRRARC